MAWSRAASLAGAKASAEARRARALTAGKINKALDRLDVKFSKANDMLLRAGRNDRYSDLLKKTDPIALHVRYLNRKKNALMDEVARRSGPGYYRIPRGIK
jgi:hypothetical protein